MFLCALSLCSSSCLQKYIAHCLALAMSYSQRGTDLAEYVIALNRRSNAEYSSMPSKRMRLEELLSLNDSNLASVVNLPIIMPAPVDELDLKRKWTFRPSSRPKTATKFEHTHTRPMPLPYEIDLILCGEPHACVYLGHGKSKVVNAHDACLTLFKVCY